MHLSTNLAFHAAAATQTYSHYFKYRRQNRAHCPRQWTCLRETSGGRTLNTIRSGSNRHFRACSCRGGCRTDDLGACSKRARGGAATCRSSGRAGSRGERGDTGCRNSPSLRRRRGNHPRRRRGCVGARGEYGSASRRARSSRHPVDATTAETPAAKTAPPAIRGGRPAIAPGCSKSRTAAKAREEDDPQRVHTETPTELHARDLRKWLGDHGKHRVKKTGEVMKARRSKMHWAAAISGLGGMRIARRRKPLEGFSLVHRVSRRFTPGFSPVFLIFSPVSAVVFLLRAGSHPHNARR